MLNSISKPRAGTVPNDSMQRQACTPIFSDLTVVLESSSADISLSPGLVKTINLLNTTPTNREEVSNPLSDISLKVKKEVDISEFTSKEEIQKNRKRFVDKSSQTSDEEQLCLLLSESSDEDDLSGEEES